MYKSNCENLEIIRDVNVERTIICPLYLHSSRVAGYLYSKLAKLRRCVSGVSFGFEKSFEKSEDLGGYMRILAVI